MRINLECKGPKFEDTITNETIRLSVCITRKVKIY